MALSGGGLEVKTTSRWQRLWVAGCSMVQGIMMGNVVAQWWFWGLGWQQQRFLFGFLLIFFFFFWNGCGGRLGWLICWWWQVSFFWGVYVIEVWPD
jgi:hypothetical protein